MCAATRVLQVGASGGLSALASLLSGLVSICGAAARSGALLRAAACLGAVGAVGGLLLCVGAAVFGGLLTAGNGAVDIVLAREFPQRAAQCAAEIDVYAEWVGRSLLALAACCALGAIGAVTSCDASCKAAAWRCPTRATNARAAPCPSCLLLRHRPNMSAPSARLLLPDSTSLDVATATAPAAAPAASPARSVPTARVL